MYHLLLENSFHCPGMDLAGDAGHLVPFRDFPGQSWTPATLTMPLRPMRSKKGRCNVDFVPLGNRQGC